MQNDFIKSLPLPIAVVGLGISGRSVLRLLLSAGLQRTDVLVFDNQDKTADFSDPTKISHAKTLVVSPGVPLALPWIVQMKKAGVVITSELEVAYSYLKTEQVIGVTGSIGKSTVTSLIGVAAQALDPHAFVGGNLGIPLADYAFEISSQRRSVAQWVVLELSSYQLENFKNLRCRFSVFTYLTSNHLERYDSIDSYYQSKLSLVNKTTEAVVANQQGGDLSAYFKKHVQSKIPVHWEDQSSSLIKKYGLDQAQLLGSYNQDNLATAAKVAALAGWPNSSFAALKVFPGLSHRLENAGTISGIKFINDSKATTMESVLSAVQTIFDSSTAGTLWVMLGGHDKNLPWERLQDLKRVSNLRAIFFGEFAVPAHKRTQLEGPTFKTLKEALDYLPSITSSGDIVLLSPGGTSHDEFQNFEKRGEFFKQQIYHLFH